MASSPAYRVLLLGILPVVAVFIYMYGQHYDPALIRFQAAAPAADQMESFFPDRIEGISRAGQVRIYTKENLYEYVNGHAEYFISGGFSRLYVGEYREADSESDGPDAIVDIYDMGKSIQAFGILADESGGTSHILKTGSPGFLTQQGLSFVKGQYYVKISSFKDTVRLDVLAESIDGRIGTETDPFPEFSRLPDIGEIVQTKFIKEAYRGLDFLNNVIEREYRTDRGTVHIFLFTGREHEVKKLVAAFMDFFRDSEIEYNKTETEGVAIYAVNDPYEGSWTLVPLSGTVYGIYGAVDSDIINKLIEGDND